MGSKCAQALVTHTTWRACSKNVSRCRYVGICKIVPFRPLLIHVGGVMATNTSVEFAVVQSVPLYMFYNVWAICIMSVTTDGVVWGFCNLVVQHGVFLPCSGPSQVNPETIAKHITTPFRFMNRSKATQGKVWTATNDQDQGYVRSMHPQIQHAVRIDFVRMWPMNSTKTNTN